MSYIDIFLANAFEKSLRDNLGDRIYPKIQEMLKHEYNMTVTEAIQDIEKIEQVLKVFFAGGSKDVIEKFMDSVAMVECNAENNIKIKHPVLEKRIIDVIYDTHCNKIIRMTRDGPKTHDQICKMLLAEGCHDSDIAESKIQCLVDNMFLMPFNPDGQTLLYYGLIRGINVKNEDNKISVNLILRQPIKDSLLLAYASSSSQ